MKPMLGSDETPLENVVIHGQWLTGEPSIWVACEFKAMKKIDFILKRTNGLKAVSLCVKLLEKRIKRRYT